MYRVCKRLEISGAHRLELPYPSKCSNLHGHNWLVTIFCKSKTLDKDGMVIDFTHIKKIIMEKLDHNRAAGELLKRRAAEDFDEMEADIADVELFEHLRHFRFGRFCRDRTGRGAVLCRLHLLLLHQR